MLSIAKVSTLRLHVKQACFLLFSPKHDLLYMKETASANAYFLSTAGVFDIHSKKIRIRIFLEVAVIGRRRKIP